MSRSGSFPPSEHSARFSRQTRARRTPGRARPARRRRRDATSIDQCRRAAKRRRTRRRSALGRLRAAWLSHSIRLLPLRRRSRRSDPASPGRLPPPMSTPRDWWIELDDRTGAERRHTSIDGEARLEPGELLRGPLYGRHWRIDRIDHGLRWAVALPDDQRQFGRDLPSWRAGSRRRGGCAHRTVG